MKKNLDPVRKMVWVNDWSRKRITDLQMMARFECFIVMYEILRFFECMVEQVRLENIGKIKMYSFLIHTCLLFNIVLWKT